MLSSTLVLLLFYLSQADRVPLFTTKPVLSGRDVVAYQQGIPEGGVGRPGNPNYAYNFSGFTFYFSSPENKEIFIDNPWRFIPAYGGFGGQGICCDGRWGPSFLGPPGGIDVAWIFINGKMYLNQWEQYTEGFLSTDHGVSNIKVADSNWIKWWGSLYSGPFNTKCFGGHDQHDVEEDMCFDDMHIDYSDFAATLTKHKDLLDDNYFQPPRFDCFYKPPPKGSAYPLPSTTVSAPKACPPPPPTPGAPRSLQDNDYSNLFVVGLIIIGACSTLGGFLGVGFYFWRIRKLQQIDIQHQPVVNMDDGGDSLSFSDSQDEESDELSL